MIMDKYCLNGLEEKCPSLCRFNTYCMSLVIDKVFSLKPISKIWDRDFSLSNQSQRSRSVSQDLWDRFGSKKFILKLNYKRLIYMAI